ncbi:MAG: DUF6541 family protein, partial [Gemmatimonadota bacterium]
FTWLGAVLGLMLVAHPQLAYYAYLALAGYAVGSLWSRRKQGSGQVARILGGGLVAAVIAIGVAAFVLFPMYRYLRTDSPRSGAGKGFEHAASYSLHAAETFSLFDPDFVGTGAEPGTYWGKNPLKDNTEYGGVLVLVLGVGAVIALKHDRRRWGLAAISAVALLYGLGAGTPFFRIVYTVLPGVKSFRAPSLATFLFIACATILSAMLLERVLAERDEYAATILSRSLLIGAGLALLVTVFAAAGGDALYTFWTGIFGDAPGGRSAAFQANLPHLLIGSFLTFVWCAAAWGAVLAFRRGALSARMCVLSLTAITVLDLARVDLRYLQVASYADFFPADPGIDALRTTLGPGERVLDFPGVFPSAGYLATNRIPQVFGYHGNQLRWYDDLTRVSVRDGATTQEQLQKYWFDFLNSPVLKALAARIIIFPGKIDLPGMQRIGGDERVSILRNSSAMPGAWLVSRVVVEPDSAKQIDMLWRPDFDVATEAVTASALPSMQQGGGTGKAEFTSDAADSVVLKTTASGPAVVVLSRNFHPSWNVTIDGAPASVARVDYALLGVPVSAGTHTVVFRYRPAIVVTTRRVTLATWAAVLMLTLALAGVRYFPRASRA